MLTLTSPPPKTSSADSKRSAASAPLIIGFIATLASAAGSWVPSMWGDEAASVMSAQRSWESLAAMIANVDAVHAVYYAFLHLWVDAFGASAFSVRFPSAIAVGVTAAGVYVLCTRLNERWIGIVAAVLCVLLPRMGYLGTEARSTAFSAALATWLTVLLLELIRTRARRGALLTVYAAGLVLSVHVFLYTTLLIAVHGLILVAVRVPGATWRRWLTAVGTATLLSTPFVVICLGQRGQIGFLARRHVTGPTKVLIEQWFGAPGFALVAWILILVAAVGWWRIRRGVPLRGRTESVPNRQQLFIVAGVWLALPTLLLLAANVVAGPLYTGRYLSFSAPAAAVLIALGITGLGRTWLRVLALAVVLCLAVPLQVAQRLPTGKHGNDWSEVSALIGARSHPGDGIVFDESVRPSRKPRLALRLYPGGFTNVVDLGLRRPYWQTDHLWDLVDPLTTSTVSLVTRDRVWVVARSAHGTDSDEAVLADTGLQLAATYSTHQNTIRLYTKAPS